MEIRREVYSSIIKVVSCLYTMIGGGIVYPFDYRFFLLIRYSAISILLYVLYEGGRAKIFEFFNLSATMIEN